MARTPSETVSASMSAAAFHQTIVRYLTVRAVSTRGDKLAEVYSLTLCRILIAIDIELIAVGLDIDVGVRVLLLVFGLHGSLFAC